MFRSHSSGIGRAARRRLFSLQQLEQRRLLTVDLPDLISRNAAGTGTAELAADMTTTSLSADGRFHVFETAAADVVSSDDNNASDVFLRDLLLGSTELISRSGDGGTANNHSRLPSISGDGEYVVFSSTATDLDVTGSSSSNAFSQIYRWHRVTGAIELISVNAAANGGGNQASFNPSVSSDGQRIAFVTQADDLVSGVVDGNSSYDVYLRDLRSTPTTILVSHHHAQPLSTGDGWSGGELPIKLSRDGTRVVYISQATDLEAGGLHNRYRPQSLCDTRVSGRCDRKLWFNSQFAELVRRRPLPGIFHLGQQRCAGRYQLGLGRLFARLD